MEIIREEDNGDSQNFGLKKEKKRRTKERRTLEEEERRWKDFFTF